MSDPTEGVPEAARTTYGLLDASYIQNEQWFEVSRGKDIVHDGTIGISKPYILIINSYGRLRKLYTEYGGYEDLSDGGAVDQEKKGQ